MTNSAKNVALLAPVPLEHLVDEAKVVQNEGRVALGQSRLDFTAILTLFGTACPWMFTSMRRTQGPDRWKYPGLGDT